MYTFFFLFVFSMLSILLGFFLQKQFTLAEKIDGTQIAWKNLLKNMRIWSIINLAYATFFAYSVTHNYSIGFIPIILLILLLLFRNFHQKNNGGIVVLNCGLALYARAIILAQIYSLVLSVAQITASLIGVLKGLLPPDGLMIFLLSTYIILSNLQDIELKSNGISLVYGFVKWKDIKHYNLQPSISKRSGYVIFKIKKEFPLALKYCALEVSERHWHDVCEILERYLPNKQV